MKCYYPDGRSTTHQQWLRVWRAWHAQDYVVSVSSRGIRGGGGEYHAEIYPLDAHTGLYPYKFAPTPVAAFCAATADAVRRGMGTNPKRDA